MRPADSYVSMIGAYCLTGRSKLHATAARARSAFHVGFRGAPQPERRQHFRPRRPFALQYVTDEHGRHAHPLRPRALTASLLNRHANPSGDFCSLHDPPFHPASITETVIDTTNHFG